ncbi:alpha/beta hydrolase [Glaciihabitans sp. UYNi722]|uniref:alpha/beta fold hydrolase n=1 Tax=Glaciihabitans sp. UYNi722 TaxID=3156344 RepID=UPI0033918D5B
MINGRTKVRDIEMAWTSEGEGPLTLWAHGMTNDRWALERAGLYDWTPVVESGRRLVRFDWRSHGESTGHPVPAESEWTNLADDLLAFIDELSPDAPVAVMGSSMGTASTLIAASRAPERFTKLVLSAPPTAWETRPAQAGIYAQAADLAETAGAAAFEKMTSELPRKGLFLDLPNYPPTLRVSNELLPTVLRGGAASNLPDRDVIASINVPALILSWADDTGHPISTGEELSRILPHNEFHVAQTVTELRTWGALAAEYLAR